MLPGLRKEAPQVWGQQTLLHFGIRSGKGTNLTSMFIFVPVVGEVGITASWAFPKPSCSSPAKSTCYRNTPAQRSGLADTLQERHGFWLPCAGATDPGGCHSPAPLQTPRARGNEALYGLVSPWP